MHGELHCESAIGPGGRNGKVTASAATAPFRSGIHQSTDPHIPPPPFSHPLSLSLSFSLRVFVALLAEETASSTYLKDLVPGINPREFVLPHGTLLMEFTWRPHSAASRNEAWQPHWPGHQTNK